MDCPLQVGNESLPKVKEFKHFWLENEWNSLGSLYCIVETKRELSGKAKLKDCWGLPDPGIPLVGCALQNGSAVGLLCALLSINTHRLLFRAQHS